MQQLTIRDMQSGDEGFVNDEGFVATCSHVNESPEIDAAGISRLAWLREHHAEGVRTKVALLEGKPVGFAHLVPVELSPWGPLGHELAVLPCLFVKFNSQKEGAGAQLVQACEAEARAYPYKALVVPAYYWEDDFWFMPARFFEHLGYNAVQRRGIEALLWKPFAPDAEPPQLLEPQFSFEEVPGKVIITLFWNAFCPTSSIEAQRVRKVVREFGDAAILREYQAENRETFLTCQCPRAIYINGNEIGWGYEAPEEGIRAAILAAMG